jgi:hypothetical protein
VEFEKRDLTDVLTPIVRNIFADDRAKLINIGIRAISDGGGRDTAGVFKVNGVANVGDRTLEFALIAKLVDLRSCGNADGASGLLEIQAYTSGMLGKLPAGIRAPLCHGLTEMDGSTACLWLEDVSAYKVDAWTMEGFELAAHSLGMFNGRFCGRPSFRDEAWWSRDWLKKYVAQTDPILAQLPQLMHYPLVSRCFTPGSLETVESLWSRRGQLLERLDQLPTVFCHLDAHCRNMFFMPTLESLPTLCLIDWATAGVAPLGAELSALVVGSVLLYGAEPSELPELQVRALRGYIAGLKAAGWGGRESDIFESYATFSVLRYTAYQLVRVQLLCDERSIAWAQRVVGHPIESFIDRFVEIRGFLHSTLSNQLPEYKPCRVRK